MESKKSKRKPRILNAADLVHLNKEQRLALLGGEQEWLSRRDFLKKLLGTAAIVVLPAALSSCTSEQNTSTTTSTGTTPKTVISPTITKGPRVERIDGIAAATAMTFKVLFDKDMDSNNFQNGVAINPSVPIQITKSSNPRACLINLQALQSGKSYELRIKGTCKDANGNPLDGNGDGIGGDDFSFIFIFTGKASDLGQVWPTPVSPSVTPTSPSCPGQCRSWGGSGCFCEVQCSCQLYRI